MVGAREGNICASTQLCGEGLLRMVQKVLYDTQVQELKLVNCHLCSSRMNYSICCVD